MAGWETRGTCNFCGQSFARRGMARHLAACPARRAANQEPLGVGRKVRTARIFHLLVEGTYAPMYWMHLEVSGDEKLSFLDRFLRDIWLECCGHLSLFRIGYVHYHYMLFDDWGPRQFLAGLPGSDFDFPEERDMNVRLDQVLTPGLTFAHEYDFGTTTDLTLKVIGEREGEVRGKDTLHVMARNDPPPIPCDGCGEPATQVCSVCIWGGEQAWLCAKCAPQHPCGEDMLLPVVNSPRVGMCAYTG